MCSSNVKERTPTSFWCMRCLHMLITDATDIGGQNELGKKSAELTVRELQLELYLNTYSSGSQSF